MKKIIIPIIIFVVFELLIIFLPKIIKKNYLPWFVILIFTVVFILVEILVVLIISKVTELKEEVGFNPNKTASETLPYADINEIRQYILDFFLNHKTNPVNLELADYAQEGIVSVGKESEKTEVYIVKFVDGSALGTGIYYVGSRVKEPNKLKFEVRTIQPEIEDEIKILSRIANQLAKSPEPYKETDIIKTKDEFGEPMITKRVRIPESLVQLEKEKEEVEEM